MQFNVIPRTLNGFKHCSQISIILFIINYSIGLLWYIHVYSVREMQIKLLRGRPRDDAHSLLRTLIWFSEEKVKAKTFIQRRKSNYVELLRGMSMTREVSVCPLTFWWVSITNQVISFYLHTVKWFQVLLLHTNNSNQHYEFICEQLNSFKNFSLIPIV